MAMENLLHLILGWLLGLVTLGIGEMIRRVYRKRELVVSVTGELAELQYVMASTASRLRMHLAEETDEFLDWLIPIISEYAGPAKIPGMEDSLREVRRIPAVQRRIADLARRRQGVDLALVKYDLPFLTTQLAELSICAPDFQRRVIWVTRQLDYFNQVVEFARSQFDRSFDSAITDENRAVIETNLTNRYTDLARRAESIAKAIGDIRAKYQPKEST